MFSKDFGASSCGKIAGAGGCELSALSALGRVIYCREQSSWPPKHAPEFSPRPGLIWFAPRPTLRGGNPLG
jgi:hypothetical protein